MRHKYFLYILLLVVTAGSSSCKKYLDLAPKNQRTVVTVKDAETLLASYLRGIKTLGVKPLYGSIMSLMPTNAMMMFEAYSDNIDFEKALTSCYLTSTNSTVSAAIRETRYANWYLYNDFDTPREIWTNHYTVIGFLNALIEEIPDLTDGTEDRKNQLLGELYAHRAYYFLKLLQYFAPYNDAENGIPVYLQTGTTVIGASGKRKTHAQVYEAIISDLDKAMALVNKTAPDLPYNIFYNKRFLNHLLAQTYWFKAESPAKAADDYAKVKTYTTAAIESTASVIPKSFADMNIAWLGTNPSYPSVVSVSNSQGAISPIYGASFQYLGVTFGPRNVPVSPELANLYVAGDVRIAGVFNSTPANGPVGKEGAILNFAWPPDGTALGTFKRGVACLFKPEEAYLMLAEANYRLGAVNDAVSVLNEFKSFRNAGTATGLSGNALLQEIVNERRREFFGDCEKRWLDLKRFKNKTINRSYIFFGKNYTVSVAPDAYQYALPIPQTEIAENRDIIQNPGWLPLTF